MNLSDQGGGLRGCSHSRITKEEDSMKKKRHRTVDPRKARAAAGGGIGGVKGTASVTVPGPVVAADAAHGVAGTAAALTPAHRRWGPPRGGN